MPYAPGNWGVYQQGLANFSRGSEVGAGAIASGLDAYAARRDKVLEDNKRKADLTKSLRTMFSVVDEKNKDKYSAMGLPELQGQLESYSMRYMLGKLKEQQQQQQQEAAIGEALKRYATRPDSPQAPPVGGMPPTPPPTAGFDAGLSFEDAPTAAPPMDLGARIQQFAPDESDRIRYALSTPGLGGSGAVRLMSALQNYHGMRQQNLLPVGAAVPVGEMGSVVGTGDRNQFVQNPRALTEQTFFNPDQVGKAIELPGTDSLFFVTSKSGGQIIPKAGAYPVTDPETGEAVNDLWVVNGKITKRPKGFSEKTWVTVPDPTTGRSTGWLKDLDTGKTIDPRSALQKSVGETGEAAKPAPKADDNDPLGIRKYLKSK